MTAVSFHQYKNETRKSRNVYKNILFFGFSGDDRSTPSQELSPTAGASDEEASYHSMDQKEQEAIAAMLTLSSASVDEDAEAKPVRKETAQQPLVMSQ